MHEYIKDNWGVPTDYASSDNKLKDEPRSEKTGLQGFRPGLTQTGLYSHRRSLEA